MVKRLISGCSSVGRTPDLGSGGSRVRATPLGLNKIDHYSKYFKDKEKYAKLFKLFESAHEWSRFEYSRFGVNRLPRWIVPI